jgi:serine phosphatase RsbU (regulator of sigma subunit)
MAVMPEPALLPSALVVDDDPLNVELLCAYLEREGYRTTTAASGEEALDLIDTANPDIVFLDVMMPGMSGFDACVGLKRRVQPRFVPIVLVTALSALEDRVRGLEAGADEFLSKPVDRSELLARARSLVRLKRSVEATEAAHQEIQRLNEQLEAENLRMRAELDVARQLQAMVLPRPAELAVVQPLSIVASMQPALEVGGDYYDVLLESNGKLKIGIGDVTGHGLESGVLMLMVQTAVRTLMTAGEQDSTRFLSLVNRVIWSNLQRLGSQKDLTLALLDYEDGRLRISGQHESVLLVRSGEPVEVVDTILLGFPVGLVEDITEFVSYVDLQLEDGDVVVLYSDGIVEAGDPRGEMYGIDRLCAILHAHRDEEADAIKVAILSDLSAFIGARPVRDDITVVVLKQRS